VSDDVRSWVEGSAYAHALGIELAGLGEGSARLHLPFIQVLAPAPATDLVAYGRVAQRDHSVFWSDVEVARADDGQVCARGTVLYRMLI